jgi:hypothetical protein
LFSSIKSYLLFDDKLNLRIQKAANPLILCGGKLARRLRKKGERAEVGPPLTKESLTMQPTLFITRAADINKLLAFLRAGAQVIFNVKEELRELVIQHLKEFARSHRISIHYVTPSNERVVICAMAGTLVGAGAGAMLAGIPGALIGAGAGLALGYACAHLSVSVRPRADGESGFVVELARR